MSEPVTWTTHPARARPLAGLVVLALVAAVSVLAGRAMGPGLGFTAWIFAALLLGSVSGFLLPTRYELDDERIRVRHLFAVRTRERSAIRRIEIGPGAARLSPFPRPRRLDRFRALVVPLDGAPGDARARLERWRATIEAAS